MALTIGTNAYESLDGVRAYWAARDAVASVAWVALDDMAAEMLIRRATDYVDRNWDYIGDMAEAGQRLKWPRKYAEVEGYCLSDSEIPWQVAEATAIIADLYRQGSFDLEGIVTDNDVAISRETVDVITIEYDTGKRLAGADIPSHVHKLLRPLTRGTGGLKRA